CLRPNRRVEISSSGALRKLHQEASHMNGGTQGPAPLYKK
ncbi:plastocyanin, partial [Rodentibacter pneumotropicus]